MIGYRRLLAKYIDHVSREEGSTFLSGHNYVPDRFTPEEWGELGKLEAVPDLRHLPRMDPRADTVEADDDEPWWREVYTDTERCSGVAPRCSQAHVVGGEHDTGSEQAGFDAQGVYDCCPGAVIETWDEAAAVGLVALLNQGHARLAD